MAGRLDGKVAIVTGAARGLGAAIVTRFAQEGGKVIVADVLDEEGTKLAGSLPGARYEHLDVRREESWQSVIARTEEEFGPVSVLVNNAGVGGLGPIAEFPEQKFRDVIDVNQVGVFLGMKSVLPSMQRAGGGSIINLSSIAGLRGAKNAIAYAASKFAVRGMTKVAALEFGPLNIRVNSIHPGVFDTPMIRYPDGRLHEVVNEKINQIPLGRLGEASEVANMALLLASDEMSVANGGEFVLDGGLTCL